MLSECGRECLLDIYAAGDFFGSSCLSGALRIAAVTAMSDTVVRHSPSAAFLALLAKKGLSPLCPAISRDRRFGLQRPD
jgi:CRP-like cAMP-binding protein